EPRRGCPADPPRRALRQRLRLARVLDEADLAAGLEHGEADVGQVGDLLLPGRFGDLLDGEPFALEVALDHLAVLNDDEGLAFENRSRARKAVAEPGDEDLEDGDRPDDEDRAGERV